MARTLYAGRPGDTVVSLFELGTGRIILGVPVDATGSPVGVTLTVWDEPDGTQYTDLLAADGVTAITAVEVPSGEIQIPAFYGPNGVDTDLWLKDPEGDFTRIDLGPPGATGPAGGVTSVDGQTGVVLIPAASTTVEGKVELATTAETTTGTDTTRAVTAAGVKAVGDTKQPLDTDLTAIAALTSAANKGLQSTGTGTWALYDLTTAGKAILDDADAAAQRATLGAAASTLGGAEVKAAASATTGSTTLNCATASVFSVTPTGNITTVSLTNVPASGTACTITFIVNQGATPRTIATPSGGVFLGAATPTQVANKTCVFTYLTVDGGTVWYCSAAVQV